MVGTPTRGRAHGSRGPATCGTRRPTPTRLRELFPDVVPADLPDVAAAPPSTGSSRVTRRQACGPDGLPGTPTIAAIRAFPRRSSARLMTRACRHVVISPDASGRTLPNGSTEARTRASPNRRMRWPTASPYGRSTRSQTSTAPHARRGRSKKTPTPRSARCPATAPATDPKPSDPLEPSPPSRREQRELRKRDRTRRRTRSTKSRWIRRGIAIAIVLLLIPVRVVLRAPPPTPGHRLARGPQRRVDPRPRRQRHREHDRAVVVHEQPARRSAASPTRSRCRALGGRGHVVDERADGDDRAGQPEHLPPPTRRVPTPAPGWSPTRVCGCPTGRLVGGLPAEYITFVRPDAVHTSYYTALMWLDTKLLRAGVRARVRGARWRSEPVGFADPRGRARHDDRRVQLRLQDGRRQRRRLLRRRGGARRCVDGAASLVIKTGRLGDASACGVVTSPWRPTSSRSARTSCCIVDNGQLEPRARRGRHPRVRCDARQQRATCGDRASVSTADGALIYAGGPSMSVLSLARTLQNGRRGAGHGDRHQHRLGERVHLRERSRQRPQRPGDRPQARRRHVPRRRPLPPARRARLLRLLRRRPSPARHSPRPPRSPTTTTTTSAVDEPASAVGAIRRVCLLAGLLRQVSRDIPDSWEVAL